MADTDNSPVQRIEQKILSLDKKLDTFDSKMGQKLTEEQAASSRLIEEAKRTPTENEARLEQENTTLKEALKKAEAGLDRTDGKVESLMKKYGIPIAAVVFIVAMFAGVFYLSRSTEPVLATSEPAPSFLAGPVALT